MKFFTKELYERTQADDDAVLDVADLDWEAALESYQQHLQAIGANLPRTFAKFRNCCFTTPSYSPLADRANSSL